MSQRDLASLAYTRGVRGAGADQEPAPSSKGFPFPTRYTARPSQPGETAHVVRPNWLWLDGGVLLHVSPVCQ